MRVKKQVLLKKYTTFQIGGPAEFLVETKNKKELAKAIKWARKKGLVTTVLGGGSNVLVSDEGIEGLVLINRSKKAKLKIKKREGKVRVEVETGVSLAWLIKELLARGITGLEKFVGIPGTVGGAVFGNIHGRGGCLFEEVIEKVEVLNLQGKRELLPRQVCDFAYNASRFQQSGEVILGATLVLPQSNLVEAKRVAKEWGRRKIAAQPANSAGCVFKNLSAEKQKELGLPTTSFGYVIDKILGLKGKQIGGAKISEKHANFIVNQTGEAKAKHVWALINLIKKESQKKLGFVPELEISVLGKFT